MPGFASNESKQLVLATLLASGPFGTAFMGLSTYSGPVDQTTVAGTLVGAELTVTGYARAMVTGWGFPTLPVPNTAESLSGSVSFINTSGVDSPAIYSWFIIDTGTGHLLAAGRYDVPFVLPASAAPYQPTVFAKLGDLPP